MVPSAFMLLDELPLSPNGKVDRKALSALEMIAPQSKEAYVQPSSPEEVALATIFANVLGVEPIGIHANFFDLGGHSLLATQVITRVRDTFQIELPLRAIFEAPSVAGLAEFLRTRGGAGLEPVARLAPVPRDGRLPLSFAQQALWFIDQLLLGTSSYSIPIALCLSGALDAGALERGLSEIVRRHEALRTVFPLVDGEPVQQIQGPESFHLTRLDLGCLQEQRRNEEVERLTATEARQPFDLARGPLFRATLVRLGEDDHLLLVTMHHIVSDGWSLDVFNRELSTLYDAFSAGTLSASPELPIQYADYAVWQRQWLEGEALKEHVAYWKQQLEGAPWKLELPADRSRPAVQTLRGARYFFDLPANLAGLARAVSQKEGTTLFMTFLAAFKTFLYVYTDQEDLLVGSPFNNRTRPEIEGLIGPFVNTVVLRTRLSGNPSFRELLGRVRDIVLSASGHQELPFEKVVEALRPPRDPSRNPLFQVNFRVLTAPPFQLTLPELSVETRILDSGNSKFDLALELWALPESLRGFFEYSTDLFDHTTITRICGDFEKLLTAVLSRPDSRLDELTALQEVRTRLGKNDVESKTQGQQPRKAGLKNIRRKAVELRGQKSEVRDQSSDIKDRRTSDF
jgi:acyl carrier protein